MAKAPPSVDDFRLIFCVDGAFDWCTDDDIQRWLDSATAHCTARVPAMYLAAHLMMVGLGWVKYRRAHGTGAIELVRRLLVFDEIPAPGPAFYGSTRYGRVFWQMLQCELEKESGNAKPE